MNDKPYYAYRVNRSKLAMIVDRNVIDPVLAQKGNESYSQILSKKVDGFMDKRGISEKNDAYWCKLMIET